MIEKWYTVTWSDKHLDLFIWQQIDCNVWDNSRRTRQRLDEEPTDDCFFATAVTRSFVERDTIARNPVLISSDYPTAVITEFDTVGGDRCRTRNCNYCGVRC